MTNAKLANVQVTLLSVDPLRFDITSNDLPKDANGDLVFANDHHPGFNVDFHFTDETKSNYLFPPNPQKADAVWSVRGPSNCATVKASEVFEPLKVSTDGKTLSVHNSNAGNNVGHFGYTLRVTKDTGAHFLALDPGGLNTNGPVSANKSVTALIVTLLVVAAAAFIAYKLFLS